MMTGNIVASTMPLINDDCYDATPRGFEISNDFVQLAPSPTPPCVGMLTVGDPMFTAPATGDFHTNNPAASGFGAYGM